MKVDETKAELKRRNRSCAKARLKSKLELVFQQPGNQTKTET